jgi:hypothetical protein
MRIYDWSYDGFMVLNSMTMSKLCKVGIAGAPVSRWRFYDTIYAEALNGLLEEHEDGYASAPLARAKDLSGKLLIVHGDADDNVRAENAEVRSGDAAGVASTSTSRCSRTRPTGHLEGSCVGTTASRILCWTTCVRVVVCHDSRDPAH